ncbi:AraC family transcriptional regulator [Bradyrhizobium sp. Arg237L]|uniref:helix-turn-helix domain-containing protein n=1 Tax=Bradyrhizobium sp. Arg237L TaxID=3003352 RepID=UPI00249F7612|nr:AraC family transcriptional regulator [Bradyrhizobium sp. Arg237L]MDI4239073.1 AraC family transcriptional regulator [Bradyrhizobium sp. Arg237L]
MFRASHEPANESSILRPPPPDLDSYPKALRPQLFTRVPVDPSAILRIGYVRGGLSPRVLRCVRCHIDAHIDQRISIEALAKLANLSVCYFVRAFKQSVGLTPHNYLIGRRVERTMELLSRTDLSLSEIALAAGFADQSHFARRFRQYVGMSPRDYRACEMGPSRR